MPNQTDAASSLCVFAPEHYQGMLEAVSTGFERNGYPFVDVIPDRWYTDSIRWAWHEEIAGGADADHFAPERPCTRAEAITMLWRACGQPEPQSSSSPFTDVPDRRYYTTAVS